MTTPTEPDSHRAETLASVAEVLGLGLVSAAGFFIALPVGLALTGAALFCLGYFGLARS